MYLLLNSHYEKLLQVFFTGLSIISYTRNALSLGAIKLKFYFEYSNSIHTVLKSTVWFSR